MIDSAGMLKILQDKGWSCYEVLAHGGANGVKLIAFHLE
jgi:hypothetical protein